jgi:hypothetical protein
MQIRSLRQAFRNFATHAGTGAPRRALWIHLQTRCDPVAAGKAPFDTGTVNTRA